ncbi:hypothetical protein [Dongshaea marina]|uniref:hypothetical protein n=1 Tax=Dongshaea marina TaxID=2047966 RepID=UPI000D3E223E|nr:hypothetical protein [Dongshaea marina]
MPEFKKCSMCSALWKSREDFISDPEIVLNGYKADFESLDYGLFLFTHEKEGCCSTLAVEVGDFKDLYQGQVYSERKTGGPECPRYCKDEHQLARCKAKCECAYVRELMQMLK